jgi:hypothetical protein
LMLSKTRIIMEKMYKLTGVPNNRAYDNSTKGTGKHN